METKITKESIISKRENAHFRNSDFLNFISREARFPCDRGREAERKIRAWPKWTLLPILFFPLRLSVSAARIRASADEIFIFSKIFLGL
jgi:hypothetical protein